MDDPTNIHKHDCLFWQDAAERTRCLFCGYPPEPQIAELASALDGVDLSNDPADFTITDMNWIIKARRKLARLLESARARG